MSSSKLPADLPKSLAFADLPESIRNPVINAVTEEIFDPWQGKSHHVTRNSGSHTPISLTSPAALSAASGALGLAASATASASASASTVSAVVGGQFKDMLEAKQSLSNSIDSAGDEEAIITDASLSREEKSARLQKILFASASDGQINSVRELLGGPAKEFINLDAKDDSGSTALIYASCFGNEDIAVELLRYGASVDEPDQCEYRMGVLVKIL